MAKLVVLGGSAVATPELVRAIRQLPERHHLLSIVLYARRAERLESVAGVASLMAEGDPLLQVSWTTDLSQALEGADLVLNQIRAGGLEARAFDESFPLELGIPGEETVGPGGFSNAFRTIPPSLEYARKMEQVCPTAQLFNFANPSSMVQYAIQKYSQIKVIGLCNGPISAFEKIAAALNLTLQSLSFDYLGMHHFGWVTGVWQNGKNMMPEVLAKAEQVADGVEPELIRAIGAVPGPYFNYFFHADRMLEKKRGKPTRAEELLDLQDELLDEYKASLRDQQLPGGIQRRKARWYADIVAPVLNAFVEQDTYSASGTAPLFYLNVKNGNTIPWLPADAVVEVPVIIEKGRARPVCSGDAPPDVKAMLQSNCAYEMLAVEAIVENDRGKALRALLRNPLVHTYDQAVQIIERVWNQK